MKRLFIWLLSIVVVVVAADVLFGVLFDKYMTKVGLKGDYEVTEMVMRQYDYDLVVLGSSVALNSINTSTLENSLGITTINGAANGQELPFFLTMLKAIVDQREPEYVILGMGASSLSGTGVGRRYKFLAPYYGCGISDIDTLMNGGSWQEKMFLQSNFYRLNTIWFRILLYNFVTSGIKGENGFVSKPMPPEVAVRQSDVKEFLMPLSEERRRQVIEFIQLCKSRNIRLMIVLTPQCYTFTGGYENAVAAEMSAICEEYGIPFYDDTLMSPFNVDNTLFYDNNHINIEGSKIYTDSIISRLK